jgi:hypothetical protein
MKLRREKEEKSKAPLIGALQKTEIIASKPNTAPLIFPPSPLSPTERKVLTGVGIVIAMETFFPGFFDNLWQKIQDHWQHYDKSDRRPIIGLKRSH